MNKKNVNISLPGGVICVGVIINVNILIITCINILIVGVGYCDVGEIIIKAIIFCFLQR